MNRSTGVEAWNERFSTNEYVFGKEPSLFLRSQAHLLNSGMNALAVADGEGRNGVWLAEQGLDVLSVDGSANALAKAKSLASSRGVQIKIEVADLSSWKWPKECFDVVVAIFIQFAGPELRDRMFEGMMSSLKSGGLLMLQGYRPEQIAYGTGGPSDPLNMYDEKLLKKAFKDMEILHLNSYDRQISEGSAHVGMSALIDMVARKA